MPKVWSAQDSIFELFVKYGLGSYEYTLCKVEEAVINEQEFTMLIGAYDCFKRIQYKKQCRKIVLDCWKKEGQAKELNILKIMIAYSDLNEMNDAQILDHINNFNQDSAKYKEYLNELKAKIDNLEEIVDFN